MLVAHLLEWLHLALRWAHVVAAIAWVGASFYFIWVENALSRNGEQRIPGLAGHLWSVHGGGFYYLEKYKGAPPQLPSVLHWFKWEAYMTWLSGVALLVLIYYINAQSRLVASGSEISSGGAVAVSIGALIGSWLGYDGLCRTPLLRHPLWMAMVGLLVGVVMLWVFAGILTPRAAYLHLGAMMGTVMAGNVFFVIIPSQKHLVAAATSGTVPDLSLARRAALRSLHNNYLTLPAVFLMISAHYPIVYQHANSGILFVLLVLSGGFVRHFFNRKNSGSMEYRWLLPAFLAFAAAAALSLPQTSGNAIVATTADIRPLIVKHCAGCHSAHPTDAVFRIAPLGFVLDSEKEILASAVDIYQRTVIDRSMPFNNQTNMSEEERKKIAAWYEALQKEKTH